MNRCTRKTVLTLETDRFVEPRPILDSAANCGVFNCLLTPRHLRPPHRRAGHAAGFRDD